MGKALSFCLRNVEIFDDPETERVLLESIAQCERGQTVPLEQVLAELRSRE
jgi:hypothetical protein